MVTEYLSDQDPRHTDRTSPAAQHGQGPITRELGLSIARDGTWSYLGSPIRRIELVRLFASVLRREADGSYWLVTPVERGRIPVEDAPFVGVELAVTGAGPAQRLRLRSNLDAWVTIGPKHPLRWRRPADAAADAGAIPYVEIRRGLEARLARPIYYQLVELADQLTVAGRPVLGVWSEGQFFALDAAEG